MLLDGERIDLAQLRQRRAQRIHLRSQLGVFDLQWLELFEHLFERPTPFGLQPFADRGPLSGQLGVTQFGMMQRIGGR